MHVYKHVLYKYYTVFYINVYILHIFLRLRMFCLPMFFQNRPSGALSGTVTTGSASETVTGESLKVEMIFDCLYYSLLNSFGWSWSADCNMVA